MDADYVLTVEQVEMLYRENINAGFLRSRNSLESAVGAPFHTFDGVDLFPTVDLKAARLLSAIQGNQPFSDGNKRISWLSMTVLLEMYGLAMVEVSQGEAAQMVLDLANRRLSEAGAALWISERSVFV